MAEDNRPYQLMHATALKLGGFGAILRGAPGAGKSDLALRLMDRGHTLIGDDQIQLTRKGESVMIAPVEQLAGLLEVRGLGILRVPNIAKDVLLACVIDLHDHRDIDRLPPADEQITVLTVPIRRFHVDPFDASAPLRVEMAMDLVLNRASRHA